jgi:(2S)-methylsuccinyl-CoA dehydrogenase
MARDRPPVVGDKALAGIDRHAKREANEVHDPSRRRQSHFSLSQRGTQQCAKSAENCYARKKFDVMGEASMPVSVPRRDGAAHLLARARAALAGAEALLAEAQVKVRERVSAEGRLVDRLLQREQRAAHALAWLATYVEAMRRLIGFAQRLEDERGLDEIEDLLLRIGLGEFLAQITGGIPMSQGEIARLADMGLGPATVQTRLAGAAEALIASGNTGEHRARLVELLCAQQSLAAPSHGLSETLDAMREELRKFAAAEIAPHAQRWHRANSYVPLEVVARMADLGVFGLTIPEEFGGMGLGKEAMCVVAEELSRGYLAVGSFGTRSEIAAELILAHGTPEQMRAFLPRLACGEMLPTAVFTEPEAGSDLGAVRTRAERHGSVYRIFGNKTWITHSARADLMTLLVRTNPKEAGHAGLSLLLAEKPRGSDRDPFPAPGMSGTEIEVLGYRGMKEYEIAFDGFEVPVAGLLGGVEGVGFKQLMQTFESARIQTAARSIGVAQAALDQALGYAQERRQFGKPLIDFPRVADKIAMMSVELMLARQLAYYAAREKDSGRRCDVEAGMAKLLAARVAWAAADNNVQVHGGNGFALESPASRLLCDARVLSIFEGAAEIQADVVARRLLAGGN